MKNPDEDDYGYYGNGAGVPRYKYSREYSPNRVHHQQMQQPPPQQPPPEHYGVPSGGSRGYSTSGSSRYGTTSRGNLVEYAVPPCCHQFYHSSNPPLVHPSSSHSHFNTIPHPPLQYRDLPACSTLNNRSYGKRSSNPYATTYYEPENPYSDPRRGDDIYYTSSTSTISRHPRHSSRNHPQEFADSVKIYDTVTPPPPPGFHSGSTPSGHFRSYAPPPPLPTQQNSLLRVDQDSSRVYSSPALSLQHYGSSGGGGSVSVSQRSNSPQHSFIDSRSISLIRLDNSNNGASSMNQGAQLHMGGSGTRIKFPHPSDTSLGVGPGNNLVKSTIELGADPLSNTPIKSGKYGLLTGALKENVPIKHVVEMSDKCVMTSQHPEQWLMSASSGSNSSNERRVSFSGGGGQVSPNQPQTLSGGIPDLLPTCVVGNNAWRNPQASSPRRHHGHSSGGGSGPSSSSHHQSGHHRSNSNKAASDDEDEDDDGATRWELVKKYVRKETKIFFGLNESEKLKEEWFARRKRFASRRYSERNVDSMPPPSPYLSARIGGRYSQNIGAGDQPDAGRIPTLDQRPMSTATLLGRRRRKKDNIFGVYWNLLVWLFWAIRFGRTGQRVAAGAGCGSDTNPGGCSSTAPGRVPLNSQISRNRSKSRSITPNTLAEVPPNITFSPQELFFDDYDENSRNPIAQLQPPGRAGIHWRIARQQPIAGGLYLANRIPNQILNRVLDNSERQRYRQNHLREAGSSFSKLGLIDEYEDFRPYFTWWISVVQTIILIASVITYGFAPFGVDLHRKSSLVLVTSLSLQQMEIIQPANFWIGPSASDLIHLGAKFAPCMRLDESIHRRIIETRDRERNTACCIRNDNSGCVQSSRNECSIKGASSSGLLSTWKKWSREEGPGGRISGSVCGLDPKFCEAPASVAPYEWPDDITKWPICRRTRGLSGMSTKDKTAEHMVCEVVGHPCCIGIHAKCLITTREYCRFVNGYFHEEASLCSQVSCLQDVCGMFPFLNYEQPDQLYRLFSSLFLHGGFGHLFWSLCFHFFIMRDLEKLAGPLRIAIIYFGSGIAGNLASIILEPHRAEVGPGGSQYGLIACLLIELLHMWKILKRPFRALGKMLLVSICLFLLGFLPWIDNFAHVTGFIVGLILSHACMPYISFGKYSTYRKWLEIVICFGIYFGFLVALLIIFYAGLGDCEWCRYFNCLPLTEDFCAEQDIDFKPSGTGINLIT